jgi:hypothetical protein
MAGLAAGSTVANDPKRFRTLALTPRSGRNAIDEPAAQLA